MDLWKALQALDPGILPSSADLCILGEVLLRSNLSRKHLIDQAADSTAASGASHHDAM